MDKLKPHRITCALKYVFVLAAAVSIIYGVGMKPTMDQRERVACHLATATDAQAFGQNVLAQNQENEELTEEEVAQQVNALINQTYESNYVLCLRNKGL